LDRPEIEAEPRHVLLEHAILRSGVEQHGMAAAATLHREETGKSMGGAAQAAATENPCAAATPAEAAQLGLDERRHGRQRISDVVDDDLDVERVDRGE